MTCSSCRGVHSDWLGETLGGYRLAALIGSGGAASVYEARHEGVSRGRVAIKILHRCHRHDARLHARFAREARASALIHADREHPAVIAVLADGVHETGAPFLVMPRLCGITLEQRITDVGGRPWSPSRAVDLVLDAASGLGAAHARGVVHRDVKPSNLFAVSTLGGGERCVVLDFGIAKLFDEPDADAVTGDGRAPGTPEYMAPEQWFGQADPRTDVYALAAVLCELLAGEVLRLPSRAGTAEPLAWRQRLRERRPDVPPALLDALAVALDPDPDRRHQSMAALHTALCPWARRHAAGAAGSGVFGAPVGPVPSRGTRLHAPGARELLIGAALAGTLGLSRSDACPRDAVAPTPPEAALRSNAPPVAARVSVAPLAATEARPAPEPPADTGTRRFSSSRREPRKTSKAHAPPPAADAASQARAPARFTGIRVAGLD